MLIWKSFDPKKKFNLEDIIQSAFGGHFAWNEINEDKTKCKISGEQITGSKRK